MKAINRLLINICSNNLEKSKGFYVTLFDFEIDFDSDWFIHLISKKRQLELGIISNNSDLVPEGFRGDAQGFYITLVVDDVDDLFETAISNDVEIVAEPHNTFYGQRRLLLKDPTGTLIDVSSPIAMV